MDDQIIVRMKKETKQEFATLAKQNGTDSSALIREYIDKYIKENAVTPKDVELMWNLGQTLQKEIGMQKAFKFFKELQNVPDVVLITNIMNMLAEHKLPSPKILLDISIHSSLKNAFLAGLIGEVEENIEQD